MDAPIISRLFGLYALWQIILQVARAACPELGVQFQNLLMEWIQLKLNMNGYLEIH